MASYILLSEKYLRAKSIISNNTDYDLLQPLIEYVQDIKIDEYLGSNLLNQIITEAQSTLSADNTILLNNYILPAMQWLVAVEAPVFLKFRFVNAGVMENRTENSDAAQTSDVLLMEKRLTNIANAYVDKLKNFIAANLDKYPATLTNTGLDQTKPVRPYNAGGLFLDDNYCTDKWS